MCRQCHILIDQEKRAQNHAVSLSVCMYRLNLPVYNCCLEIRIRVTIHCVTPFVQLEWQRRCESSEKIIEVLQDRLESARRQLQDQDVLKEQLQTELKIVAEELQIIRTQREQDLEKIDKV